MDPPGEASSKNYTSFYNLFVPTIKKKYKQLMLKKLQLII